MSVPMTKVTVSSHKAIAPALLNTEEVELKLAHLNVQIDMVLSHSCIHYYAYLVEKDSSS